MSEMDIIDVQAVEIDDSYECSSYESDTNNETKIETEQIQSAQDLEVQNVQKEMEKKFAEEVKEERETQTRYSSAGSKNKTYSSVNKENDFNSEKNTNYDKKSYDEVCSTKYENKPKSALWIILAIVTCPIWISAFFSIFGILMGLTFGLFGAIFGVGVATLAVLVAGITVFIAGICSLIVHPITAICMTGVGLVLAGLGLLGAAVILVLGAKVLPACGRLIGNFFAWIGSLIGGRRHE